MFILTISNFQWIQGIWKKIPSSKYWRSWNLCPKPKFANLSWPLLLIMNIEVLILMFYIWLLNTTTLGTVKKKIHLNNIFLLVLGIGQYNASIFILEHFLGPLYYACTLVANNVNSIWWASSYNGFRSIIFVFMVNMIVHTVAP